MAEVSVVITVSAAAITFTVSFWDDTVSMALTRIVWREGRDRFAKSARVTPFASTVLS